MDNYRLVLADDHTLIRQGIKRIIEETLGMPVVGEADDGLELLKVVKKHSPDMVVVDISMPHCNGIDAIREIKRSHPHIKILILTMHDDVDFFHEAVSAGADGYLLKQETDVLLFAAVRKIRAGETFLSPRLIAQLSEDLIAVCRKARKPTAETLSARERQVLKLVVEGNSSKDIEKLLFISCRTVERHRENIMKKLNVKKTADLIKYVLKKKLI